jgi:DNA-binding response OmpR family regulator
MARQRKPLVGMKILIVEDDFLVGQDLRGFLEDAGADVLGPIANIAQGCDLARKQELDGALLDVRMWNETAAPVALELTRRHIPFIVVTGHAPEEIPPAMQGAAYLAKPVPRLDLIGLALALFA